jgi:hypothetical protein
MGILAQMSKSLIKKIKNQCIYCFTAMPLIRFTAPGIRYWQRFSAVLIFITSAKKLLANL